MYISCLKSAWQLTKSGKEVVTRATHTYHLCWILDGGAQHSVQAHREQLAPWLSSLPTQRDFNRLKKNELTETQLSSTGARANV